MSASVVFGAACALTTVAAVASAMTTESGRMDELDSDTTTTTADYNYTRTQTDTRHGQLQRLTTTADYNYTRTQTDKGHEQRQQQLVCIGPWLLPSVSVCR